VRSVDLAIYADALAAEAASLAARAERERSRLRQAAIERAAREALAPDVVARLEALGLLATRADPSELHDLEAALDAVEELQAWVEARLAASAAA
jgi:tRNA U34 5-methylaminomethyl-2-thiouridine-forming methyltransferase MnmC